MTTQPAGTATDAVFYLGAEPVAAARKILASSTDLARATLTTTVGTPAVPFGEGLRVLLTEPHDALDHRTRVLWAVLVDMANPDGLLNVAASVLSDNERAAVALAVASLMFRAES